MVRGSMQTAMRADSLQISNCGTKRLSGVLRPTEAGGFVLRQSLAVAIETALASVGGPDICQNHVS